MMEEAVKLLYIVLLTIEEVTESFIWVKPCFWSLSLYVHHHELWESSMVVCWESQQVAMRSSGSAMALLENSRASCLSLCLTVCEKVLASVSHVIARLLV